MLCKVVTPSKLILELKNKSHMMMLMLLGFLNKLSTNLIMDYGKTPMPLWLSKLTDTPLLWQKCNFSHDVLFILTSNSEIDTVETAI